VNQRITSLLAALFIVLLSAFAGAQTLDDEIRERLTPAGSVCVFGEECAAGLAVAGGASGPRDGETIYNTFCMACHATGVSEAPILGNAEQWAARVAKGTDVLYTNSINGINIMPPRGTCVDCTDDEMQTAVDFMLDALQ
jgi:cytochrome c5